MIQLMARLHGIKPEEQPDYGQDVPGVVKGTAVFGLLSSGIVLAHVFGLLSTSLFVVLRTGTGWSVGQSLFITILSVLGIAALSFSGLLIWASRRGKLLMRDRVIAGLNLRGDEQVLDVGCGNGLLLIGAAQQLTTGTAVGVDIWRSDLESDNGPETVLHNAALAGVADRVQVHDANAQEMPFPDGRFDVVLTSLMLHHMDNTGREKAMREMARVLKPGGKLVVVDIAFIPQIKISMQESGFTAVRQISLNMPMFKQVLATK